MKERIKRTEYLKIRLTQEEKQTLKLLASADGSSVARFCRSTVLQKENARQKEARKEFYALLVKYQNSFASLSNLVKKHHPDVAEKTRELADLLLPIIKRLYDRQG